MGISIEIKEIGNDKFKIQTSGSISSIITNADRDKFGIDDDDIKEAVNCYKGRRPDNVYLCSPTPWNDMYKSHDLDQTEKIVEVKKAKVIDVSSRPVTIKTQSFDNMHSSASTLFETSIEETVSNMVSSSWNNQQSISVGQSISYDIKVLNGQTSFNYSQSWGSTKTQSKEVTMKWASSAQITLAPGTSAVVELIAHKKVAKVEVTYECYLEGDVGINYNERYNGYHHHFVPIETIMKAGDIDNSIIVKEVIEIELYNDSSIMVKE